MEIGGLQKTTLIDYPGKIACTVFTVGCNFRCPFCYSSELVLPEKTKFQPRISEESFFAFLEERRGLLEGVVLCGGEPTIHPDLPSFAERIKKMDYLVKLDTNGSNPDKLEELINDKLIDYVAMDIKAPLDFGFQSPILNFQTNPPSKNNYEEMTGGMADLENIRKSISILQQGKIGYEFRTTVSPGLKKEDILKMADYIRNENASYFLQEFKGNKDVIDPRILNLPTLKEKDLKKIANEIKHGFKDCQVR